MCELVPAQQSWLEVIPSCSNSEYWTKTGAAALLNMVGNSGRRNRSIPLVYQGKSSSALPCGTIFLQVASKFVNGFSRVLEQNLSQMYGVLVKLTGKLFGGRGLFFVPGISRMERSAIVPGRGITFLVKLISVKST